MSESAYVRRSVLKLATLVETSRRVAATRSRRDKTALLAELLAGARPDEIELAVSYLCGVVRQEKLGLGWAALQAASDAEARPTLFGVAQETGEADARSTGPAVDLIELDAAL